MDPTPKQFQENMKVCSRRSLIMLRWCVLRHKANETLPEIGLITVLITLGEILLWLSYPPELQSAWTTLAALWASAWLVCVAIISVPRSRTIGYRAHWIGGD